MNDFFYEEFWCYFYMDSGKYLHKLKEIQPILIQMSSATVRPFLLHQEQERAVLVSEEFLCSFCSVISGSVIPDQTFVLLSSATRTKWHLFPPCSPDLYLILTRSPGLVSRMWLVSHGEWVWSLWKETSFPLVQIFNSNNKFHEPSFILLLLFLLFEQEQNTLSLLKQENVHVHLSHPLKT